MNGLNWLNRLERIFGGFAIPEFPLFIVVANGLIYVLMQTEPFFYYKLLLDPYAVWNGEWWRVVTFLFVPPPMSAIFMVFWLYLLYQYARALEHAWGEFQFCFFYLTGAVATTLAALFIVHATLSNIPLNTTLFLAFATLFPDFELLLFFILPVKVKYLAWLLWATLVWSLITGSFVTRIGIAASLVNYLVFFGPDLAVKAKQRIEVYRNRRRFKQE